MAQPVWITPSGSLGVIPDGQFFATPIQAYDPDGGDVFFEIIAGRLPSGIQCAQNGLLTGIPKSTALIEGVPTTVYADTVSKFSARSYTKKLVNGVYVVDRVNDRTFTLTVAGLNDPIWTTPAGEIAEYLDGAQITDLQVEFTAANTDFVFVSIKSGSLPPGLSISDKGLITGVITPLPEYDPDTGEFLTSKSFSFTLEVTDGQTYDIRTFSILVYAHRALTADNIDITADNTFITADASPIFVPVILSPAPGTIGPIRNDNFFAIQFVGTEPGGGDIYYELDFDPGDSTLLPGLTLDPNTGWLYGYIPNLGITENTYNFYVRARLVSNPSIISENYAYSLVISGPVSTDITWLTPNDLGTIDNGATSMFYVRAVTAGNIPLQYQLKSGAYNSLPQGLQLLPSGNIVGRVSFDTFAVDGGTTTFDATNNSVGAASATGLTTFDMVCRFVVNAYSANGLVSVDEPFSITINRAYNKPYNNLYIQAMPPQDDRNLLASLLQNLDIFKPSLIYRPDDINFGKASDVVYYHAFGLNPESQEQYVESLYENHYWKRLTLGSIKVAQAVDSTGAVVYEVVYSEVVDDLVNAQGQSVSKQVTLPYPVTLDDSSQVETVYPNSLIDMRDQVIDVVGQQSNVLPLWMTSKQADGRVLGFTPAWVIAYTNPGQGNQLAYYIQTQFGDRLNTIDFEVDRYELDRLLTKNWDTTTQQWDPHPASYTTFDAVASVVDWQNDSSSIVQWINNDGYEIQWINGVPLGAPATTFDENSLMFIDPVDMYIGSRSGAQVYDKYLVFPKRNILE